jgi:uncharacterized protein
MQWHDRTSTSARTTLVGNALQDRDAPQQDMRTRIGESTRELQILEQSALEGVRDPVQHNLSPSPIAPDWILEGNPVARSRLLSKSTDGQAETLMWDCTAGRFTWHYGIDETVYVVEGSVLVTFSNGDTRRLKAGDSAFFPSGSHALWRVERYVRKIAFCRSPVSRKILFLMRCYQSLARIIRREPQTAAADNVPAGLRSNP